MRDCDHLTLQEDGQLAIRSKSSDAVNWTSSVTENVSVSWVKRLNSTDGTLCISDDHTDQINQTNKTSTWIVIEVTVRVSFLAIAGLALLFSYAETNILYPAEKAFRRRLEENGGRSQTLYSESKIKQATNNFGSRIAPGGFGVVFYCKLPDRQENVAQVLSAESQQTKQEFYNEVKLLFMVHHKHLVSLLGHRCTRKQQILVYEYMRCGDLQHRLLGVNTAENPLTSRRRTSIALQVV